MGPISKKLFLVVIYGRYDEFINNKNENIDELKQYLLDNLNFTFNKLKNVITWSDKLPISKHDYENYYFNKNITLERQNNENYIYLTLEVFKYCDIYELSNFIRDNKIDHKIISVYNDSLYCESLNELEEKLYFRSIYLYNELRDEDYYRVEYFNIIMNTILNPDPDRLDKYKNLEYEKRILTQIANKLNTKIKHELVPFTKFKLLKHLNKDKNLLLDYENLDNCENSLKNVNEEIKKLIQ